MSKTTHVRAGAQSIVHRREFEAPAFVVQRAHTTAELFSQWMGPRGSAIRIQRFDARTGGAFDYTIELDGDQRFWGAYHEVVAGRIVHTWESQQEPGHPTLEVLELHELPEGRSALEITSTCASQAACEAMVASGLERGMDDSFERIDEALAKLAH